MRSYLELCSGIDQGDAEALTEAKAAVDDYYRMGTLHSNFTDEEINVLEDKLGQRSKPATR